MLDRYQGNITKALAAYNAGPTAVDRWLKEYDYKDLFVFLDKIPYKETREYVTSILRNYIWYSILTEGSFNKPLEYFWKIS